MPEKQISKMTADEANHRILGIKDELQNPDLNKGRKRRLKAQLNKIDETHGITRRKFLKIGGITALLGIGGVGIALSTSGDSKKPQKAPSEQKQQPLPLTQPRQPENTSIELDIDKKIEQIEAGFARFKEKVLPLLQNISDPNMRKVLKIPFTLLENNAKNKEKNVKTFAKNRGHRTDNYHINVYTSQFFYDFAQMNYNRSAASFTPSRRKMILSNDFDPDSIMDNLLLFHELIHVYNDSRARMKIKGKEQWDKYQEFYQYERVGGKPRLNLIDEATAIECELEVLNQLLGGELAKTIQSNTSLDIYGIRKKLNANNISEIGPLNFILEAAMHYFKGSRRYMSYPKALLDFVASHARKKGYDVVLSDGTGNITPYK